MNMSDPMYKMVVEPIMERIMEANEIGREYAERYIRDTVESAVNDEAYHMGIEISALNERVCELEGEIEHLSIIVGALEEQMIVASLEQQITNNKSWLSRLLGR